VGKRGLHILRRDAEALIAGRVVIKPVRRLPFVCAQTDGGVGVVAIADSGFAYYLSVSGRATRRRGSYGCQPS